MRKTLLLVAALALTAACGQEGGGPVDALATSTPTHSGWERIEHGGLSFDLRSDMEDQEAQGIDSQVGHFEGTGIELHYDYGWYSGDPANEKAPGYKDQWIRIDDRLAHVSYSRREPGPRSDDVPASRYEYTGTAYFPDTEDTSGSSPEPSGEPQTGPVKLNMVVYSNDGFDDAERIITSIRFED